MFCSGVTLITVVFSVLGITSSLAYLRHVVRAVDLDLEAIVRWLHVHPMPARLTALAHALAAIEGGTSLAPLATALAESNEMHRRIAVNEALQDLDAALQWGDTIPAGVLRISVLSTLFTLAIGFVQGAGFSLEVLNIVALGGATIGLTAVVRREGARVALRQRAAIDAWVDRSLGAWLFHSILPNEEAREGRPARTLRIGSLPR